uniref:Thyrotropin-releasing hormone receptor n=1 Tax=Meloidogyne javanica TaxID=6303 RepID=A0A915M5X2_MELJA
MRHNLTLIEVGWLCPALFSLLRVSPEINADQNSKTLLKLINGSDCKWPNNRNELMNALIEKATISGNMNKDYAGEHFLRSKKLDKIEYHQDLKISEEENNYGEDEDLGNDLHLIWAMTVIYSLIALIGIIGNILVIVVVKKVPSMITPTNCYLVSLALSDCLFLCAAWPVEFSYLHADQNDYAFGAIGCKILTFLPYLGINAS